MKWCSHSILSAVTNHATDSIRLLGSISYYIEFISAMWHHWNISVGSFMESVFFSATQWHHSQSKQCLYDRWFVKLVCMGPTKETATWSHLLVWSIFCWESVLEFSKENDTKAAYQDQTSLRADLAMYCSWTVFGIPCICIAIDTNVWR